MQFGLFIVSTCCTSEYYASRLWPQLCNTKSSGRGIHSKNHFTLLGSIVTTANTRRCGTPEKCGPPHFSTASPRFLRYRPVTSIVRYGQYPRVVNNGAAVRREQVGLHGDADSYKGTWLDQGSCHCIYRSLGTLELEVQKAQHPRKPEDERVRISSRDRKLAKSKRRSRSWKFLSTASVGAVEKELVRYAHDQPHPIPIRALLTFLIQKHKVVPARRHYEALLLANCSPVGSAKQIKEIWTEMQMGGIDMSTSVLLAALSALAIHPMLSLQEEILAAFDERWLSPSVFTQYYLIISLLRTNQLELANMLLNDMHSSQQALPIIERTPIPLFLYILFLQHLIGRKDYDASIRFIYKLRDRNAVDMDLPANFWSWVLQHSASDGDGWVSAWVWQEWVEKMMIKPTRQTCNDVMRIAARDKVSWLAESVKDTIEHGGVAIIPSKHEHSRLPLSGLSDDEKRLFDKLKDLNHASFADHFESESAKMINPDHDSNSSHNVRRGNMWPYFNHDAEYGSGRFDPWDALGPKSRRR